MAYGHILVLIYMCLFVCLFVFVFSKRQGQQIQQPVGISGRISNSSNEPPRGKNMNVVSEQFRHKPLCTSNEDG